MFLDVRDQIVDLVCQEDGDADEAADPDDDEGKTEFAEVEVVDREVDQGKDLEKRVVYAVGQ